MELLSRAVKCRDRVLIQSRLRQTNPAVGNTRYNSTTGFDKLQSCIPAPRKVRSGLTGITTTRLLQSSQVSVPRGLGAATVGRQSRCDCQRWCDCQNHFNRCNRPECLSPEASEPRRWVGKVGAIASVGAIARFCLLYTSPSPRDLSTSRMPSSA